MKSYNYISLKNFAFALFAFAVVFISAEARAETKIGIVNIQKIMTEAKAAQSIQKQLDEHRKSFQEEFSAHERNLKEQEDKLLEARAEMNAEEFSAKRQEFENELLETRKLVQKRQRALEEGAAKALGELRSKVITIVSDKADQEDYDLILTRQNVMLAQKTMDITDDVMSSLDEAVQDIKLSVEIN